MVKEGRAKSEESEAFGTVDCKKKKEKKGKKKKEKKKRIQL